MNDHNPVGAFEEFNAKYLEPEQVAAGYVYSNHLEKLAGANHAVLIGPRGSGKTTLLKMLQPAALSAWTGARAIQFRNAIKYSGVFISSDISWSRQLTSLGYGRLEETNHRILVLSCFTTHLMHAVLDTMIYRVDDKARFRKVDMPDDRSAEVAKQIASALHLRPSIPSLLSIQQALADRLSSIREIASRGSLLDQKEFRRELADIGWVHIDFLDIAARVTSLFNDAANEHGARWTLLFDELENAPDWIVEQLLVAIRASARNLYLKIAISPVSATAYKVLTSDDGPADRHDHREIRLWYVDRVEAKGFCEAVWKSLAKKYDINVSAYDALGPSAFEPSPPQSVRKHNPYSPQGYWAKLFRSLEAKDKSFAAFLRGRNIDLGQIGEADQNTKDKILRRAAPIAAVRDFYLHEDIQGHVRSRGRKTSALYSGAHSIFAISEGNPRWLIALLTPLVAYMANNKVRRVPENVQAEEIENAAERLLSLLKTIPVPREVERNEALGLNGMVERIGANLHDELVEGNFSIDPRLSFVVDDQIPKISRDLLSIGLNRGAMILIGGSAINSVVGDTRNIEARLSYLLAAKYGLPLRRGKRTSLSRLLSRASGGADQRQPVLPLVER